jgi:hypothetical protein
VNRSCIRAVVSEPERRIKRGELILTRRHLISGTVTAMRNLIFLQCEWSVGEGSLLSGVAPDRTIGVHVVVK